MFNTPFYYRIRVFQICIFTFTSGLWSFLRSHVTKCCFLIWSIRHLKSYLPLSGRKSCSLVLLYLGFSLTLYDYTCPMLLAPTRDRILKLLSLLWSYSSPGRLPESALFSRRWHRTSIWCLHPCPQTWSDILRAILSLTPALVAVLGSTHKELATE